MFWRKPRLPDKLDMTQFKPIPQGGYLVGGAVRDALLGRDFADLDWLVQQPEQVAKGTALELNGSAFPLDSERGVWRVMTPETVRDYIYLHENLEANLRERDFALNAIAVNSEGLIVDPLEGQQDLQAKTIRMISGANLHADPLRPLRAVRFATQLSFDIESVTEEKILEVVKLQREQKLPMPALERVKEELEKIISTERAGLGFKRLHDLGLLELYLPELTEGHGVTQGSLHHLDVMQHSFEALQQLIKHFPDADVSLRWATLLHDVGKPRTKQDSDGLSFHGHADVGAEMSKEILSRLRHSSDIIARVSQLVHDHMVPLPHVRSDAEHPEEQLHKEIRRFIHRRRELLPDLLELMIADREAARGKRANAASRVIYRLAIGRILNVLSEAPPKPPLLTGQDVMVLLELAPGPRVGEALAFVREAEAVKDVMTREEAEIALKTFAEAQGWKKG
ncbi:MAG: CCA tRNA nucleotidyltransferase [Trueperaceae bacterium]